MPMSSSPLVADERSRNVARAVTSTCAVSLERESRVEAASPHPGVTTTSWTTEEAKLGRWNETSHRPAASPSMRYPAAVESPRRRRPATLRSRLDADPGERCTRRVEDGSSDRAGAPFLGAE